MLLGEILDNPGSGTWIFLGKRKQNRAFECFLHALEFRTLDGAARQRVFDNTHVHAGVARVLAQLRHLGNRQTPVLGRNGRYRISCNRVYLTDKCFLVFESQCHYFSWLTVTKIVGATSAANFFRPKGPPTPSSGHSSPLSDG